MGLIKFLESELTRGYVLENDELRYAEKRKKVHAFIQIPKELEQFLFYGFLQCADAFLFMLTFLPLRFVTTVWRLLSTSCICFPRQKMAALGPPEICDLMKVLILTISCLLMYCVDTSAMYHVVRGQAVIKLYIFYNMLEVADKLFSSFGQDILDALFWIATGKRHKKDDRFGMLTHLGMAIIYVFLHALLVLLQATTLNVAFNSHNKALLTIMMSNNFVELKGSVFKKFAKNNLFQMSCSDVRERFHNCVLLLVIIIRNMAEFNWKLEHFWEMLPDLALVIIGEFIVDWMKHAFITKFNEIPFEVYKDFTITISYDVANSRQANAFSDHSDQVSRRMGFIPLPLTVVLIKIVTQTLRLTTVPAAMLVALMYAALVCVKVLNSIVMLGSAYTHIEEYEEVLKQAEITKRLKRKSKSEPASPRLSLIDFTDVMQQTQGVHKGLTLSDVLSSSFSTATVRPTAAKRLLGHQTVTPSSPGEAMPASVFAAKTTALNSQREDANTTFAGDTVGSLISASASNSAVLRRRTGFKPAVDSCVAPSERLSLDRSGGLLESLLPQPEHVSTADGSPVDAKPGPFSSGSVVSAGSPLAVALSSKLQRSKSSAELLESEEAPQAADKEMDAALLSKMERECESLVGVDRYTLCNDDRIES